MAVLINLKICDNSKDCNGIDVCPTKAFYWDEKKKTIAVDNKKCINCGKCEESCPLGVIRVAKTEKEYKRIEKEIANDPRNITDLFTDRYGAQPIDSAFLVPPEKFDVQIIQTVKLAVVELFTHSSVRCLLNSIPVKELFKDTGIKYRKIEVKENDSLPQKYKVKNFPALLFFKNGKLIGRIERYYDNKEKEKLKEKIKKIIKK